ncbi:MAG: glycine--tRNA ligase subunit beta [Planctomycetota bacterium]|nr:MAG: glycine--tRNA ligase subunit beta [Planctomycetota bacterium]
MPDLLLELACEELPARFIERALSALADLARGGLEAEGLAPAEVRVGGTPRRLALWAGGLPERQPDRTIEKAGPRASAAKKDGAWTQAAVKFAESQGLRPEDLEVRAIEKKGKTADYLYARRHVPGRPALEVLAEAIPSWIERIPFAKSMRWVPGSKVRFGRPLRGIAALLGDPDLESAEVVPVRWAKLAAGREVVGHRFLFPEPFSLRSASWEEYVAALRERKVIVDPAERRAVVEVGLREHLGEEGLARHRRLVDEVTGLVEWPVVDVGAFDARLLALPEIVIVSAMTNHQRYFPIHDAAGKLQNRFAYVANRPLHPVIRHGNERVLNARLSDALFFYRLDLETGLDRRAEGLGSIVFMQELGSLADRVPRVKALAIAVAKAAGWIPADAAPPDSGLKITSSRSPLLLHLHLAAELARADLLTEVVGEFPELQGEMGAIYAREQWPDEVAEAIREAYLPRGEGDALPETRAGICLAIADKLDTIVCAWATGKKPTGSGDPFAVRRSALGILRILRARELDLGLRPLISAAVDQLPGELRREGLADEVEAFFRDRLRVLAGDPRKGEGRDKRLVAKVLASGRDPSNVVDFWRRLDALETLARDERFGPLCELVDRTRTITQKNGADVDPEDVDVSRLEHPAEKALHEAIAGCRADIRAAIEEGRYVDAGRRYVDALAEVTHTFFEPAPTGVFVMDEDPRLRTNRLALLKQVHALLAEGFVDLAATG